MIGYEYIKRIGKHPAAWLFRTELHPGDESLLSCAELARAERITNQPRRREFVAARCAVRRILAEVTATEPGCVHLATDESGRPYMTEDNRYDFSISHSHDMCAIAVGRDVRVGIDVERVTDRPRLDRIAEFMFSPDELTAWRCTEPARRVAAFYRLWTRKEAYLKALGIGLNGTQARSTSTITLPPENAQSAWHAQVGWHWTEPEAPDGYQAALCWRPSEP